MAKNELVWFRNRFTGWVDAFHKGSPAYRRVVTEMTAGDDPEPVWERTKAPKVEKGAKFRSGATPAFQVDRRGHLRYGERDEVEPMPEPAREPAEAATAATAPEAEAKAKDEA
ncbi:MAG TPA: hypothetical protein VFV01_47705 [Spirillospora sp.]|nr:hypothetical protein [Spirillospora sp.]